jgi:hypothetical protein
MVKSYSFAANNCLIAGSTVDPADRGGFDKYCFDITAPGDDCICDNMSVTGKRRWERENCNIPYHVKMIRKETKCIFGNETPYLISQTHDFLQFSDSLPAGIIDLFDVIFLTINILKNHYFILLINDTGPRN